MILLPISMRSIIILTTMPIMILLPCLHEYFIIYLVLMKESCSRFHWINCQRNLHKYSNALREYLDKPIGVISIFKKQKRRQENRRSKHHWKEFVQKQWLCTRVMIYMGL